MFWAIVAMLGHGQRSGAHDNCRKPTKAESDSSAEVMQELREAKPFFVGPRRPMRMFAPAYFDKAPREVDIPELVRELDGPNMCMAVYAANSLRFLRADSEATVHALSRACTADQPVLRMAAAEALRQIGPAAAPALPQLIDLLTDEYQPVRSAALETIERIGVAAQASLENILPRLDEPVQREVELLLMKLRDRQGDRHGR